MSDSSWNELALEVLEAVGPRIHIDDFDDFCRLAPASAGRSYYDRLRVADQLAAQGFIIRDDDILSVSLRVRPFWLLDALAEGSLKAWKIVERNDRGRGMLGKVESEVLERIGLEGEHFVIECLRKNLSDEQVVKVRHVSIFDDGAGFDIASPSCFWDGEMRLLEVKTSSREGSRFDFFISRNEVRVARQNENWCLVAVIRKLGKFELLGYIQLPLVDQFLPVDASPNGRWETARVSIARDAFIAGLP